MTTAELHDLQDRAWITYREAQHTVIRVEMNSSEPNGDMTLRHARDTLTSAWLMVKMLCEL